MNPARMREMRARLEERRRLAALRPLDTRTPRVVLIWSDGSAEPIELPRGTDLAPWTGQA